MSAIIDISPPLRAGVAVYPGDAPFRTNPTLAIGDGSIVNVSEISLSTHCGAHADAPFHYDKDGPTVDALPLGKFIGPARVIDARGPDPLCQPAEIAAKLADVPSRVLLRLENRIDPMSWPAGYRALAPEVIYLLAGLGVELVGVDTPSVDSEIAKLLPAHFACRENDILILENLALAEVEPGDYELIALPLKLEGLDASPVRAVLRAPSAAEV